MKTTKLFALCITALLLLTTSVAMSGCCMSNTYQCGFN